MSTFQIEGAKLLDTLVPEFTWEPLDATRYGQIFGKLLGAEPLRSEMLEYVKKKQPRIGFHKQYKSGGGWTVLGNITLSPGDDPFDPYVLSLIIHETFHLQQSILTRLSMQGELRAWQFQARTYPEIARTKGNRIGSRHEAYGAGIETSEYWEELARLSPDSRADLEKAREVMVKIAPTYRSHALPLLPLHVEILFFLKQWRLGDAVAVVWNLIRGAE
jgi:hypothetical protein